MQKISEIWLNGPFYEKDIIENTLARYFFVNNIELESLQDVILEELIECAKEAVEYVPLDIKEEEIISNLKMQFRLSLTKLKKRMNVMRQCIDSANKVFKYCLKWPHVVGKYKDKLEEIKKKLIRTGQNYNMSLDKNEDIKKKIHALQVEHTKVHYDRNTLIDAFWKVKDITEGRLEQMIEVLK